MSRLRSILLTNVSNYFARQPNHFLMANSFILYQISFPSSKLSSDQSQITYMRLNLLRTRRGLQPRQGRRPKLLQQTTQRPRLVGFRPQTMAKAKISLRFLGAEKSFCLVAVFCVLLLTGASLTKYLVQNYKYSYNNFKTFYQQKFHELSISLIGGYDKLGCFLISSKIFSLYCLV